MRIIWDASILSMYPLAQPGFRGGTENMIEQLVTRLAAMGHTVHLVCRDAEQEEQRAPNLWYWPTSYHPTKADVLIETQQVLEEHLCKYEAEKVVLAHTGCDPYLGPNGQWATQIDGWPVFSEAHKQLLLEQRPGIPAERVYVVGLGVNKEEYQEALVKERKIEVFPFPPIMPEAEWDKHGLRCTNTIIPNSGYGGYQVNRTTYYRRHEKKVPGRMLYANDPMRGLFYVLDIFELVRKEVPEATLHVAYDFDRQAAVHQWEHTYKAQMTLNMKQRIASMPGVVNLGAISREELIREQLECQVHCMPSDPPNIGTQTHGITQMECAAAGAALVLSDVEAFPEVFGDAATILPVVGYFAGEHGRRVDASDYAAVVVELMKNPEKWQEASRKARALAGQHTWDKAAAKWDAMLNSLVEVSVG